MFSKTESDNKPSALKRVLIALLLVLPVVGAASYMWAMWDPKTYLKDIPLAVVSEDTGVGEGKDFTHYGEQIADGMLDLDYLNFSKATPEEAADRLERGEVMMVVTIPKDFSKKAATIIDKDPVKPNINFELNDFYGTQNAFITGSLIPELQASVSQAVTAEYSAEVVTGLSDLSAGLDEASDGATQLADGAGQIKDGVKELTDMLIPLLSEAQDPSQDLRPVVDVLRGLGMNAEADELSGLINDLNPQNPENLVTQLGALRDGTAELHYNLSDPSAPYLNGVLQLQDGAHQLRDGSGELADGTVELDDGMTELKDGTNQLSTGLRDGVAQAPTIEKPEVSSANMATPIDFTQNNINPVQTSISEEDPTATKLTSGVAILLVILFAFLGMALLAIMLPAVLRRKDSANEGPSTKGVLGGYTLLAGRRDTSAAALPAHPPPNGPRPRRLHPRNVRHLRRTVHARHRRPDYLHRLGCGGKHRRPPLQAQPGC